MSCDFLVGCDSRKARFYLPLLPDPLFPARIKWRPEVGLGTRLRGHMLVCSSNMNVKESLTIENLYDSNSKYEFIYRNCEQWFSKQLSKFN